MSRYFFPFQNKTIAERPLFCHFPRNLTTEKKGLPGASYVRLGDYKLIRIYGGNDDRSDKYVLYNIKNDISESKDIAKQFEKTAELKKKLNTWLKETGTLMPKPNPAYKFSKK